MDSAADVYILCIQWQAEVAIEEQFHRVQIVYEKHSLLYGGTRTGQFMDELASTEGYIKIYR